MSVLIAAESLRGRLLNRHVRYIARLAQPKLTSSLFSRCRCFISRGDELNPQQDFCGRNQRQFKKLQLKPQPRSLRGPINTNSKDAELPEGSFPIISSATSKSRNTFTQIASVSPRPWHRSWKDRPRGGTHITSGRTISVLRMTGTSSAQSLRAVSGVLVTLREVISVVWLCLSGGSSDQRSSTEVVARA